MSSSSVASAANVDIGSHYSSPSRTNLTIKATRNAVPVPCTFSGRIKTESPDGHYSTVCSPVANNAISKMDGECCNNSGLKMRRQRLRPWLISQINSGEIPGLVWLDKENMVFKIPWKHFGRPGVDTYLDALLFRRWALHTKKFEQGRPTDISTWKTRFRCALHKLPDIEELNQQNVTDGDEPYRVYKFRKIELEKIPRECGLDDEPEGSTGSAGSPVSTPFSIEPNFTSPICTSYTDGLSETSRSSNGFRIPRSSIGNYDTHSCQGAYRKHKLRDSEQHLIRGKFADVLNIPEQASDIYSWRHFDQRRNSDSFVPEKSLHDKCNQDTDGMEKGWRDQEKREYSNMTILDEDEKWKAYNRGLSSYFLLKTKQGPDDIFDTNRLDVSKKKIYKEKGFEQNGRETKVERQIDINESEANAGTKPRSSLSHEQFEEDDNELFFQSCAKRIRKLDSKSNGYLKLKILEQFYYVENFQQKQFNKTQTHQSYHYSSDPPPLINNADMRPGQTK